MDIVSSLFGIQDSGTMGSGDSEIDLDGEDPDVDSDEDLDLGVPAGAHPHAKQAPSDQLEDSDNDF